MMPPGKHTANEALHDSLITSKVKVKLHDDSVTGTCDIGVETFKGTVQLSGFVETSAIRVAALDIARDVDGVLLVEDLLDVRRVQ